MAAGRHGGYELRERGADFGMPKKEIGHARGDYVRLRTGDHREYDRASGRSRVTIVPRARVPKDIKETGSVENIGYRSASSHSESGDNRSGPRRCKFYPQNADREPGELSSDGSDGVVDSEIWMEESEFDKLENRSRPVETKKRKFSPIVWDRDDRDISKIVKIKNVSEAKAKSPPPLPPPPVSISQIDSTDAVHIVGSNIKSPPPDLSDFRDETLLPKEDQQVNAEEERVIDDGDEDRAPPTIIFSRWANEANSPTDEYESSGYEEKHKWKRMSGSDSSELRRYRKSITPELGEIKREDLGTGGRFTGSDEYNGSARRDSCHGDEDKSDHMQIDDDHEVYRGSDTQSHSESVDDLSPLGTPETERPLQRSVNMLQGCRKVDEFERLNKIDEGTYGVVFRAKDKKTGEIVALKKVKMEREREGFPLTALREINILLSFHHPCIVDVKEVVVGNNLDSIFMVMEYMEHDLKALMETMKQPFSQSEVKCLMLQLLEGIKYLHDNWVLHRDLKTSNLLLNNRGELKICDFGLARQYGSPLKPYTQLVVTLWYRAPELLLGAKEYSTAIDMWSLGCIMAELLSKEPLFNGKSETEQLDKIFKTLGTPTEAIWPGLSKLPGTKANFAKQKYNLLRKKFPATSFTGSPVLSDAGFDLLNKLLTYDPQQRITAEEALNHEWFREVPLPKSKEFMPTFPAHHAQDRRTRRVMKSPDPLEELRRKELQQGEMGSAGLFGQ